MENERRAPAENYPPWIDLPTELTADILERLGPVEILDTAQKVCKTWLDVSKDPWIWRVINMDKLGEKDLNYEKMCRHAVDRSQGQLVDISFEWFGTDDLLRYISERSSQLRRLRIVACDGISGKGLCEAALKFPNLEQLHLLFMSSVVAENIGLIGQSCRELKSFTYETAYYYVDGSDDGYAIAVGTHMRGLHHLYVLGNKMTNDGLKAILDGCKELESLDIRHCFNVYLEGDLEDRCLALKGLRHPCESTEDYEWHYEYSD